MIGYVFIGTNDLPRATKYFDDVLSVIGARHMWETEKMVAWTTGAGPMFGVIKPFDGKAATVGNGTMVAIAVDSRAKVDELHAAALTLGGTTEGAPGLRGPEGDRAFYGAYFRDLDGNKLCVFRIGPK